MRVFIASCIAALVIAFCAAVVLNRIQPRAAYTIPIPEAVRN